MNSILRSLLAVLLAAALAGTALAEPSTFGAISQRSPKLTAEYWNPILRFVSARSGVPLNLKVSLSGSDHAAMVSRGDTDFIYSNHHFAPDRDLVGYRVIARSAGKAISGQIVVLAASPLKTVNDLRGKDVVFPSTAAFVGYTVPVDALRRAGVAVNPSFAGNQEGAMGQLKIGRVAAAGVNSEVMRTFAKREGVDYRALWTSDAFQDIPIAVHPRVPITAAERVRDAFIAMTSDPEGFKILAASADLIKQAPPLGFVLATDNDYSNVRLFHRNAVVVKD